MLQYLRYFSMTGLLILTIISFAAAGPWMWSGFIAGLLLVIGGDAVTPDDLEVPQFKHLWLLNFLLYFTFPLLVLLVLVYAWMLGEGDWLGLGAWVHSQSGWDMHAARAGTSGWDMVGGVLSAGLLFATAGTNVGHELVHRTRNKLSLIVGRWMLALTCDASFAIEHVYGHHLNVATKKDPATARRGENVYAFIVRSTVYSYLSAWRIEKARLAKFGFSPWSWRSRMMRGNFMTLIIFTAFYSAAGWQGAGLFLLASFWGKSLLEMVNYIEHYGLVRVEGGRVEPHHSWNSNKRLSSFILYNLTRHSHHHAEADVPFWTLKPYTDAPMMSYGYLTTIIVTLIPPLWERIMIPKLRDWDARYASAEEKRLAATANAQSGIRKLTAAAA